MIQQHEILTLEKCKEICSKEFDNSINYKQVFESILIHKNLISEDQ